MCIVKHDDHFSAWKDARAYVSNLPTTEDVSLRNRTSPIGGTPVDTACFERTEGLLFKGKGTDQREIVE